MVDFFNITDVLIIKPRAIGDVLLATPVIENLKKAFPHLSIDFLCEEFARDVVSGNPWIRTILTYDRKKDSSISIIKNVRSKRYDMVIDLFANPRTALITWGSGAPIRVGFPFRGRKYAYSIVVEPRGGEVHNVEFNLDVLRHLSVPVTSMIPRFPLSDAEKEWANSWMTSNGFSGKEVIIGLNSSGGWYTKRWGIEHYARLADRIKETIRGEIILFWGPGERGEAEKIQAFMKTKSILIPATTLKQMGALLKHCSYLITNDSGPMHIAAALGVKTLGIFGPTNPFLQGPFGTHNSWVRHELLDCLGCNLTDCPIGNVCMTDLSVERVMSAFETMINTV